MAEESSQKMNVGRARDGSSGYHAMVSGCHDGQKVRWSVDLEEKRTVKLEYSEMECCCR